MSDTAADAAIEPADSVARSVFAGLAPQRGLVTEPDVRRASNPTVPILLASTLAMTMNLTANVESASAKPTAKPRLSTKALPAVRTAHTSPVPAPAPATYRVIQGDTISGIAGRFGVPTATVLALNGLLPTSLIFPGQVIRLVASATAAPAQTVTAPTSSSYTIAKGDTISAIAKRFGLSTAALLSANGLGPSSIIYPGQKLVLPATNSGLVLDAVTVSSVTPVAPPTSSHYTIRAGDTLTSIARTFGLTVTALLNANGLAASSTIYAGKTIVIPGVAGAAASGAVTRLDDSQAANAFTIINVGRGLGVSDYGIVIALAAAMQESGLRNLGYGHLDSVGLFQQRPSVGWGTVSQLTTPRYAAALFFGGPSNPNKGVTRGLLDIPGWQSMTVTQAAQKVQVSAYPNAYAKWESSAREWLSELG